MILFMIISLIVGRDAAPLGSRFMFVTSSTHFPSFPGSQQANLICQQRAVSSSISSVAARAGYFFAWLSSPSAGDARALLGNTNDAYDYVTTQLQLIADNRSALLNPSLLLQHSIDKDEEGRDVGSRYYFTNTEPDGTMFRAGRCCDNWSARTGSSGPMVGFSTKINAQWTQYSTVSTCNTRYSLLCVEGDLLRNRSTVLEGCRLAFVTTQLEDARWPGVTMGDARCQQEASTSSLSRVRAAASRFRMLLSTSKVDAKDRLEIDDDRCVSMVGGHEPLLVKRYATAFDRGETSAALLQPLYRDVNGSDIVSGDLYVRTCTQANGTGDVSNKCQEYTDSSNSFSCKFGHMHQSDSQWISYGGQITCTSVHRHYCFESDVEHPAATAAAAACRTAFVTRTQLTGDMDGIESADALCATEASASVIEKVKSSAPYFKAFLSTPAEDARDRIGNDENKCYSLASGPLPLVAKSKIDLFDSNRLLLQPIYRDRDGEELSATWWARTGTWPNGTADPTTQCNHYQSTTGSTSGGSIISADEKWVDKRDSGRPSCADRQSVYCFDASPYTATPTQSPTRDSNNNTNVNNGSSGGNSPTVFAPTPSITTQNNDNDGNGIGDNDNDQLLLLTSIICFIVLLLILILLCLFFYLKRRRKHRVGDEGGGGGAPRRSLSSSSRRSLSTSRRRQPGYASSLRSSLQRQALVNSSNSASDDFIPKHYLPLGHVTSTMATSATYGNLVLVARPPPPLAPPKPAKTQSTYMLRPSELYTAAPLPSNTHNNNNEERYFYDNAPSFITQSSSVYGNF